MQVLFTLAVAGVVYGQAPVITSVLDPYSGGTKLSPGGRAVITGTNLGVGPLVTVGGINAFNLVPPQLGGEMTIEIPVNAPLGSNVPVIVTTGVGASAAFNITLAQYAPVLISDTSGALTSPRHSTGVGVTSSSPAAAGETVTVYAIGMGPTTPAVNTGVLAPQGSPTPTTTSPTVTLGTNTVSGATARLANSQGFFGANYPGGLSGSGQALIAIYLVTFTVPAGTATGSYPLTLSIGGATSNSLSLYVGTAPSAPVITAIVGEQGKTALCPGDIAILSGLNLGANPTVTVGGKTAFNLHSPNNGNEMTIQIPVDAPVGAASVTLAQGGQTSASFSITLTAFAPALVPNGGGGVVPPFHQYGSPVSAANPAAPGETLVINVYGLGATNPVAPTGTPAPGNPIAMTVTTPTVHLGGIVISNPFAALSPDSIGTYFVSFTVPPSTAAGNYGSWISIGGVNTGLFTVQVFTGPIITNVSNAASNIQAGLPNAGIAQGAIFIATGTNLGPGTLSVAQDAFQSTTLNGTSINVTVGGTTVAALMYYTSATQVAALLPSSTPVGTGTVEVTYNGQVGANAPITVVQSNLGIFTVTSDGQGVGIVTYPDYSLVSVTKASNCGGPYTTCGAANPGDTLTIWATGLGPVSGSDAAGAGLGVDMTSITPTVWVGGVSAQVVFRGRGCCIGEDQIAFIVPDNVPTGCAVPLAVQIGNEISNYAVMAVAPKGSRTCAPSNSSFPSSAVSLFTSASAPITYSELALNRFPNVDAQGNVSTSASTDAGSAQFLSFTVPQAIQPFIVSYLDDLPAGTCTVYNALNPPDPGNRLTGFQQLDGGPSTTLTGPNGIRTIAATGNDVTLGPGTYLSPGAYTFSATGGADIGSVSAQFTIPAPPTLTNPASGPNVPVNRANGITLTWTGGASNSLIKIQGGDATDGSGQKGATFTCVAAASAGSFTIPASVLLAIPPGSFANSVWDFQPYTYGTFTATGLNLGVIRMFYATPIFTTLQ